MVLDPLSAFALAGTIVQFIDFTSKVARGTHEIYKSAEGSLAEHEQLKRMTSDLATLSKTLRDGSRKIRQGQSWVHDQNIAILAQRCEEEANLLLTELQQIEAHPNLRILRSLQKAVRAVCKQGKIQESRRRLDEYRSQLSLHLAFLSSQQNESILSILEGLKSIPANHQYAPFLQYGTAADLQNMLEKIASASTPEMIKLEMSLVELKAIIPQFVTKTKGTWEYLKIRNSLRFPEIRVRHHAIAAAHTKTFEWILSSASPFRTWLQSNSPDDGIFWISGKAGSGKSTLMKYVCDNPKTYRELNGWAAPCEHVVAQFFFWNAGTPIQRSQEGLMRTLLMQVIDRWPALVQKLFPLRCRGDLMDEDWSKEELMESLEKLGDIIGKRPHRVCFFIDGLDEFDGNHRDLLRTLMKLSVNACVKVCVSSRPWPLFRQELDHKRDRRLYVEDLTREDITLYVKDHLEANASFITGQSENSEYRRLVEDIVKDAKGVFLWVYLVVKSILEGLSNEDTIKILRRRLNALPKTLEGLFHHMLQSVDPVYHTQMARTFKLALAAVGIQDLPLIAYSALDEVEEDPDFAVAMPTSQRGGNAASSKLDLPPEMEKIRSRLVRMRTRLHARAKDLLEVHTPYEITSVGPVETLHVTVHFLHRTVRDFLLNQDVQDVLVKQSGRDFQAHVAACHCLLATLKMVPCEAYFGSHKDTIRCFVTGSFYSHAELAGSQEGAEIEPIVEMFDQTLTSKYGPRAHGLLRAASASCDG